MIYQECESKLGWQEVEVSSSNHENPPYIVTLPPWDRTEEEAVCSCPGYEYRGKCRHQREALSLVCNWSELDSEPQTAEQRAAHVCPECGGGTKIVFGD